MSVVRIADKAPLVPLFTLSGQLGECSSVSLAPPHLPELQNLLVSSDVAGCVYVWNLMAQSILFTFHALDDVPTHYHTNHKLSSVLHAAFVAFEHPMALLLTHCRSKAVFLWSVNFTEEQVSFVAAVPVRQFAFCRAASFCRSSDVFIALPNDNDGVVFLHEANWSGGRWSEGTAKEINLAPSRCKVGQAMCLEFACNGTFLIAAYESGHCVVWDMTACIIRCATRCFSEPAVACCGCWTVEGALLVAVSCAAGALHVYSLRTQAELLWESHHTSKGLGSLACYVGRMGPVLVAAGWNGVAYMYNMSTGNRVAVLPYHEGSSMAGVALLDTSIAVPRFCNGCLDHQASNSLVLATCGSPVALWQVNYTL